jgi:hypothetical protein
LKKSTKKLLLTASGGRAKSANRVPPETDKSFLVLFFKKELLSISDLSANLVQCDKAHSTVRADVCCE